MTHLRPVHAPHQAPLPAEFNEALSSLRGLLVEIDRAVTFSPPQARRVQMRETCVRGADLFLQLRKAIPDLADPADAPEGR